MADERNKQSGPPRGPSRKPVTIDLAAEAVRPAPAAASVTPASPAADGPKAGAPQAAAPGSVADPSGVGEPIGADAPKAASAPVAPSPGVASQADAKPAVAAARPAPGKDAPAKPIIPSAFAPGAAGAAPATNPAASAAPASAGRRGASFASLLLAAVLGGLVVEAGDLAAERLGWFAPAGQDDAGVSQEVAALRSDLDATNARLGALGEPASTPAAADVAALRSDLTALQGTVAELGNRPTPPADTTALDDLQRRLAALEQAPRPAAGDPAANPAVDALTAQAADLTSRLAALEARPAPDLSGLESGIASVRSGLAEVGGRLDTANAAERLAALEPKVAAAEAGATATKGLAQAVAADALASAVASGRPFAAELAALRSLGVDDPALADLATRADAGLPGDAALAAEFRTLSESLRTDAPVAATAGPVDRLLQSARGLVQVRPAGPADGADPGSVMSRIVDLTGRGALADALRNWDTLPDASKSATVDWAGKVRARLAAETLAARLRGEALARLAQPG